MSLRVLLGISFFLLGLSRAADGALVAIEQFDYAPSTLAGKNGGVGWNGGWVIDTGAANVVAGNLDYPGEPATGGRAQLGGNSRATRFLDLSLGGAFDTAGYVSGGKIGADGSTLYISLRQQFSHVPVVTPPSDPNYLRYMAFELKNGVGDETRSLIIGHDDRSLPMPNNAYGAASVVNNSPPDTGNEPGQYQPLGAPDVLTNLLIIKLDFGIGNNDTATIYRNFGVANSATAILNGDFTFDRLALARFVGNNPLHSIDEIRFGTTLADVSAVPEPATGVLVLAACALIGLQRARRFRNSRQA